MRIRLGKFNFVASEYGALFFVFLLSFFHPVLVLLLYVVLLVFAIKSPVIGSVIALIVIAWRGLLNTSVAVDPANLQMVKWMLIIGISIWGIANIEFHLINKKTGICIFFLSAFAIYSCVASFLTGSYPVISTFKLVAFALPCAMILLGVKEKKEYDWNHFLFHWFTLLFLISLFILPFNQFRTTNSDFQGIFNHVNGMGTMCAIYIAIVLNENTSILSKNIAVKRVIIAIVLFMEYQTRSRTGMISSIVVILVYFFTSETSLTKKIVTAIVLGLIIIYLSVFSQSVEMIKVLAHEFIYKGGATDVLYSRTGQITRALNKYNSSRWLGGGFMTPFLKGQQSYEFRFDLLVEPGNLFLSVLADTGIIGMLLFLCFLLSTLRNGNLSKLCIFAAAIMISMGEMVFFSSNSVGIIVYMLLALYTHAKRE